jgi:uncharacterized membrane protein (DUF373 family)
MRRDSGGLRERLGARESRFAEQVIAGAEAAIYIVIGVLLVGAAGLVIAGTTVSAVARADDHSITDTAVFVLSRVLLIFIVAELLHTLRYVNFDGRILVEPFLFIGLIAVVRRILIVTAEFDGKQGRAATTDFLIEIGALGGLTIILALAIYVLRVGGVHEH